MDSQEYYKQLLYGGNPYNSLMGGITYHNHNNNNMHYQTYKVGGTNDNKYVYSLMAGEDKKKSQ